MARIEESGGVRKVVQPRIEPVNDKKLPVPEKKPVFENSVTRRGETENLGTQQRFRLNERLERDSSALIGGSTGATAGQFTRREQQVRDTGSIKIKTGPGTPANFVDKVEADLQQLAPNTKIERRPANGTAAQKNWDSMYGSDTAAIVRKPEYGFPNQQLPRVGGNESGYRLLDHLQNNPNDITINYVPNDAYAAPRSLDALGGVANPGKGSGVDVFYDPSLKVNLPSRNPNGTITNSPAASAVVLGHELSHASHMQRGTQQNVRPISSINELSQIFGTQGRENVFTANGRNFVESDNSQIGLREEYRNVGFEGHSYGNEPTENSLRRQLGIPNERISYQGTGSHTPISLADAFANRTSTRLQMTVDSVVDGVRGSRNSALIGAGFNTVTALAQGKDLQGVTTDAAVGAGTGVTSEVIERVVNGPRSTTTGMTPNSFRAAASQVRGAAVAGAVINTGFAIYDQVENLQNDATRSQAIGTIAGEAVVGAASGAAGAYAGAMAGAAIGSIVPGVGTAIGGVVGFAAGAAAGYLADKGLRGLGVDTLVAGGVTAAYNGISNAASAVSEGAKDLFSGAASRLSSIFG